MTNKQLLTALLIAGLSATAKAEPTVYYCDTAQHHIIKEGMSVDLPSFTFKLFVDLAERRVKLTGEEVYDFDAVHGVDRSAVTPWNLFNDTDYNNLYGTWAGIVQFDLRNGLFTYTFLSTGFVGSAGPAVRAFIARCDKF